MKNFRITFLFVVILLIFSCNGNNAQKILSNQIDDSSYVFPPFIIPENSIIIDTRGKIDSCCKGELLLKDIYDSSDVDIFGWSIDLLNTYKDPLGKMTYVKSSFWDEGNDNSAFHRKIPQAIDFLLQYNPLAANLEDYGDSGKVYIELKIQFVFGQGLDCRYVQNPKYSLIYSVYKECFRFKEIDNKSFLIKNCPVRSICNYYASKYEKKSLGIYYFLNQIIVSLSYNVPEQSLRGSMVYIHPICCGYDEGQEILDRLDSLNNAN